MAQLFEVHSTWLGVAGAPYYTTLRGLVTGPVDPEEFADAWTSFLVTIQGAIADAITIVVEPEVTVIESTTGELVGVLTIDGDTIAPTGGGDMLPPATQALVQLTTPAIISGRRLRGRIFLGGMLEANNAVDGTPSGALTGSFDAALATFVDAVASTFVVYSPTHRAYSTVTAAHVWGQWAQLRSRRD